MKSTKGFFSVPFIFLIVLVVLFHNELFALGVRIYVSFKPNAYAERLLGNYYETSAHLNMMLANQFYTKSLTELKEQLSKASEEQQIAIKYRLGGFYECGRGTPKDYAQAKKFYDEALLSASKVPVNPKLQEEIKSSVERADQLIKNQATPVCPYLNDMEFIRNTISGDKF